MNQKILQEVRRAEEGRRTWPLLMPMARPVRSLRSAAIFEPGDVVEELVVEFVVDRKSLTLISDLKVEGIRLLMWVTWQLVGRCGPCFPLPLTFTSPLFPIQQF